MEQEIWKEIPSHPKYEASNTGFVRRKGSIKPIAGGRNISGYLRTSLNIRSKCYQIHRLVAEAFFGPSDKQVNHKNGIRYDNRIDNLEYVTNAENNHHALLTGLYKKTLTPQDAANIRKAVYLKEGTQAEIANRFSVSRNTVNRIVTRKTWNFIEDGIEPIIIRSSTFGKPKTFLTENDVITMRRSYEKGEHTQKELAKIYGMSRSGIEHIVLRVNWKHIP